MPQARWPNLVVLVVCVAFLVTWTIGFVRHRGRSCRCFGALSARGFDRAGIARAAVLVLAALAAAAPVPVLAVQLGLGGQLALLAGGALIAGAAYSAAGSRGRQPEARHGLMMLRIPLYLAIAQWALLGALGVLVIVLFRQLGRLLNGTAKAAELGPVTGSRAAGLSYVRPGEQMPRQLAPGAGQTG